MFNLHYYFKVCAAASLAALLGAPSYAVAERWFRVELLVFSQEAAATNEQWEAIPDLAYPDVARFLVEPQQVKANKAKFGGDGSLDQYGRQSVTRTRGTGGGVTAGAAPGLPTAFVTLPSAQREFRGKAAYMQRSGRYRTLFHETWVQPVTNQASTVPIVLDRSGDTGQWPALQGSITLHLARYLHLSTNLWLNTQGDYLPGEWRMPAPPLGPPSVLIDGLPAAARPTAAPQTYSPAQGQEGALATEEPGPVYPYRHAVLLKQKRRMRSNEVHYIDHPLLGVVIKLTPLTADALGASATAEGG
jgi:hypothetical protein